MMKRSVVITSLAVALLSAGFTGGAFAAIDDGSGAPDMQQAPRQQGQHARRGDFLAKWSKALDLTADQQAQIKTLVASERQTAAPLRKQIAEGRKNLRQALNPQTFNETAARSLLTSQAALRSELILSHAKLRSQIFALLTPDQQKQAEKLRDLMASGKRSRGGW